jgi:hypothetical protein
VANYTIPPDYLITVASRLAETSASRADRVAALALAGVVIAQVQFQSYACGATLPQLAEQVGLQPAEFAAAISLLGKVRAVHLAKRRGVRRVVVRLDNGVQRGTRPHYPDAPLVVRPRPIAA